MKQTPPISLCKLAPPYFVVCKEFHCSDQGASVLLISQTKVLCWKDIILEPTMEATEIISSHTLIGKLISYHSIIKIVWSFIIGLNIEDLGTNTFLLTCIPFITGKKSCIQPKALEF